MECHRGRIPDYLNYGGHCDLYRSTGEFRTPGPAFLQDRLLAHDSVYNATSQLIEGYSLWIADNEQLIETNAKYLFLTQLLFILGLTGLAIGVIRALRPRQ